MQPYKAGAHADAPAQVVNRVARASNTRQPPWPRQSPGARRLAFAHPQYAAAGDVRRRVTGPQSRRFHACSFRHRQGVGEGRLHRLCVSNLFAVFLAG